MEEGHVCFYSEHVSNHSSHFTVRVKVSIKTDPPAINTHVLCAMHDKNRAISRRFRVEFNGPVAQFKNLEGRPVHLGFLFVRNLLHRGL